MSAGETDAAGPAVAHATGAESEGPERDDLVRRLVPAVLLVTGLFAAGAALVWSSRNPLGASWDEALYQNRVIEDVYDARVQGLVHAARMVRWTDRARPPAYRLVSFPFAFVAGGRLAVLRGLSLAALALSVALLYWTARLFTGRPVAAAAAAGFGLSAITLWASIHFGMEVALYPATAGVVATLGYAACRRPRGARSVALWVGLAAAMAIGTLSKTSFLLLGFPAVAAFLVAGWRLGIAARVRWIVATGSLSGLLGAAPWWIVNWGTATGYARWASHYDRYQPVWLSEAFRWLLGPPLGVLAVLFLGLLILRRARLRAVFSDRSGGTLVMLIVGVAGTVPLLAAHLAGANPHMRLLSPALVPALSVAALLAHAVAALRTRRAAAVVCVACLLQGAFVTRLFLTSRIDQWDWEGLFTLAEARGITEPDIVQLGLGITFNPPAVSYPWVRRGRRVSEAMLWRLENGPIDWDSVTVAANAADVVVTAPGYLGDPLDREPVDNGHNAELAARLERMEGFDQPVELRLGRFETRVLVFFRKRTGDPVTAP